jgi:endoglycosylceramidase
MRDAFAAHWSAVARTFADAPGLAGYELLNEPWAGDAIGDIALMLFGVADCVNLQPFYDVLAGAIAAADPAGHIVMFEVGPRTP